MSQAIPPAEVENALLYVKRATRSIKSALGMLKGKITSIETTLTAITEKAEDIASEPPTTDVINALKDLRTKTETQLRNLRTVINNLENVSDALDSLLE